MPVFDSQRISDGFMTLERGVDGGKASSLLPRNQLSSAVNVTMRGGFAKTRPAFNDMPLTFAAGTSQDADQMESRFKTGLFQGASAYKSGGSSYIICSVAGYIYRIDLRTGVVNDITPLSSNRTPDPNSSRIRVAYFQQAEHYLIIQDGRNRPIIFDGANCRRSDIGANEVPTGTAMAYGGGRLWVARGREFVAGDIVGGPTDVIKFTENTYINEGGAFAVPLDTGDITAMKFMNQPDTSLGQGELLVHTANAIFAVNVPVDRDSWKNVEYPTVRIVAISYGSVSDRSCVLVNSDMFYRSPDGIRSYVSSRREWQQYGQIPVSREVNPFIAQDTQADTYETSSAVLFDNRLLATVSPQRHDSGTYYRGLVVMDFDSVGGSGDKMPPVWDGLWTGLKFLQLISTEVDYEDRCFAFHLDTENSCGIQLWEITRNGRKDNGTTDIASFIESSSFSFENPFEMKSLEYGEMFVDELKGNVSFHIKYKPNQYPVWVDWNSFSECVKYENCTPDSGCLTFNNYKPQYRTRMLIPQPADDCESTNGMPMRKAYEFSVRIGWTGDARIKGFRLHAYPVVEEPYSGCITTTCS